MSPNDKQTGWSRLLKHFVHGVDDENGAADAHQTPGLKVTSHVARDLLQNAAYFNSVPKAVTEYVTNAIDNTPPGKLVCCDVTLTRSSIKITDNASGMTHNELFNFFQMHGENRQRSRGRRVRGKFGTGKSAAFGIANTLQIETVKDGKRNVVELSRSEVENAKHGQPIPVHEIIVNQDTEKQPGTKIMIKNINVKNIDADSVRNYLAKNLGRHLTKHQVTVNGKACQYREPAAVKTYRFRATGETRKKLGAITCILKISEEPLKRDENSVAVLCNGFLHATTLAGKDSELFVEYIFGEVDVPILDDDDGPIPAFDNTRNLSLNQANPRVKVLLKWLAVCIEKARKELVLKEKRRRYSKEMRQLRKVACEIKSFLDDDFRVVQDKIPWATLPVTQRNHKKSKKARKSNPQKNLKSVLDDGRSFINRLLGAPQKKENADKTLANIRKAGRVEFEIHYVRLGANHPRARFIPNRRTIYLNRDHPQLRIVEREAGIESTIFKMLSFDIAFTEYALAVVSQLADQGIEIADPIDASDMVQEILDRLGRRASEKFYREASLQIELSQSAGTPSILKRE